MIEKVKTIDADLIVVERAINMLIEENNTVINQIKALCEVNHLHFPFDELYKLKDPNIAI